MKKLFVSVILCILTMCLFSVCVSALPVAVEMTGSATVQGETVDIENTLVGEGTQENPYRLSCAEDFLTAAALINAGDSDYNSAYYVVTDNVDFEGTEYVPLGADASSAFSGNLDGGGYKLYNLAVNDKTYFGIIGYMTTGSINNVNVEYKNTSQSISKMVAFGGIAGYLCSSLTNETIDVSNCSVNGSVELISNEDKSMNIGGVFGMINAKNSNINVNDCLTNLDMSFTLKRGVLIGGFAGKLETGPGKAYTFNRCVSNGDIFVSVENKSIEMGGFAGQANKDDGYWSSWVSEDGMLYAAATTGDFRNCIATGNVVAEYESSVSHSGGFVASVIGAGEVVISNCYRSSEQIVSGSNVKTDAKAVDLSSLKDPTFLSETVGLDLDNSFNVDEDGNFVLKDSVSFVFDVSKDRVSLSGYGTNGYILVCTYSGVTTGVVKTIPVTGDCSVSYEELGLDISGADRIRAFLFDSSSTLKPFCENAEIILG